MAIDRSKLPWRIVSCCCLDDATGAIVDASYIELRLDLFPGEDFVKVQTYAELKQEIVGVGQEMILTFRDQTESNNVTYYCPNPPDNVAILNSFIDLPTVRAFDVEVKNLGVASALIENAHSKNVDIIASAHYFNTLPSVDTLTDLDTKAAAAEADILCVEMHGNNVDAIKTWLNGTHQMKYIALINNISSTDRSIGASVLEYYYASQLTSPNMPFQDQIPPSNVEEY